MEMFFMIVGLITYALVAVAIVSLCCLCVAALFQWATKHISEQAWHSAHDTFLNQLSTSSYWFSECPKTMRAFQLYCEQMTWGGVDISQVRDKWRSEFEK